VKKYAVILPPWQRCPSCQAGSWAVSWWCPPSRVLVHLAPY